MDIPGFHYDPKKKKYFRVVPGVNNHNPLTNRDIIAEEVSTIIKTNKKPSKNIVKSVCELSYGFKNFNKHVEDVIHTKLNSIERYGILFKIPADDVTEFNMRGFPERSCAIVGAPGDYSMVTLLNVEPIPSSKKKKNFPFRVKKQLIKMETRFIDCADFGHFGIITYSTMQNKRLTPWGFIELISLEGLRRRICDMPFPSIARCITANENTGEIALGSRNAIFVSKYVNHSPLRWTSMPSEKLNIWSVRYNSQNNVLYCGTNRGSLLSIDHRTSSGYEVKEHLCEFSTILSDINILKDGHSMILSSVGNEIKLFDIRMGRTIVKYPTFPLKNPFIHVIPVSVDEASGVVCSMCQDGNVRMWNLLTGSLYTTINVSNSTKVPVDDKELPFCAFTNCNSYSPAYTSLIVLDTNWSIRAYDTYS